MKLNTATDKSLAYLLLRVVLGVNIAVHGISRLLTGPTAFASSLVPQFSHTPLPSWSIYLFALCLPWVETVVGLGSLFGIATRFFYVIGLLVITALTFGTTLRQDWQASGLQLSYGLVYAILLATRDYNTFSFDGLLQSRSRSESAGD